MRRERLGPLLLAFLPIHLDAQQTPARPTPLNFEKIFSSVVTLVTYANDGKTIAQGSGFIVQNRRVVTNRHVIEGARIVEVKNSRGELLASFAFAEAISMTADVAVLPAISQESPGLPLATLPSKIGERVYAIGSPLGLPNTLSDGLVSALRSDLDSPLLQITAPISPGSSGGPVINERGEVIGVATSTLRAGQNLNFAVPANIVAALTNSPPARIEFPARRDAQPVSSTNPEGRIDRLERPSLTSVLPQTPIGWIDEKEVRIYQQGCFADEAVDVTLCVIDIESKVSSGGSLDTIGIGNPVLTSPQGGQSRAIGAWLNGNQYVAFNDSYIEFYISNDRPRIYLTFSSKWREGASYQLSIFSYGGESSLKKFWSGRNVRSYTFNPQSIVFIDGSKDALTKKIFGIP